MRRMLNRWIRGGATLAGALSVAMVALLLPASPAHALGSGESWAGSRDYYRTDAFQINGTLPGVRVHGFVRDVNGTRQVFGSVVDTADDDRCARVIVGGAGAGLVANETVCGNGTSTTYLTREFTGRMIVVVQRLHADRVTGDKIYSMQGPDGRR
ncbi:MAG TPA: hypothetical protein VF755_17950 [Catenuloplanes sp.]